MPTVHVPVLLQEIVKGLDPQLGETVVDATLGGGGHARALAERIGEGGTLLGIDQDRAALKRAETRLKGVAAKVITTYGNFRDIARLATSVEVTVADKILFDIGLSSDQFEQSGRGFTFQKDEPLLMTMNADESQYQFTAFDIVNDWEEEHLIDILENYGEEKHAKQIAHAIVTARQAGEIKTTFQLISIIERAVPSWYRRGRIHFATKTFQALRIAVNDELTALKDGLAGAWQLLNPAGRLAVITFHSLEARIVKNYFALLVEKGEGELINKHAIKASREEILSNPRSRSAQLRVIKKLLV